MNGWIVKLFNKHVMWHTFSLTKQEAIAKFMSLTGDHYYKNWKRAYDNKCRCVKARIVEEWK